MLAGFERRQGLRIVQKRRGGDVDQVDVVAGQELVDVFDVGNAEPPRGGQGRLSMRSRHSGQLHARHLGKLLKGIEPEAAAADHAQSDFVLIHAHSVFRQGSILEVRTNRSRSTQLIVPLGRAGQFRVPEDRSSRWPRDQVE